MIESRMSDVMQRPWGSRSLSHQLLCNSILLCSSIRRIQSGFPQTCIQRSSAHNPLPLRWPKLTLTLRRAILSHFTLSSFKSPQLRMGASFLRELPPMGLCKMCVCVCVCVCMHACAFMLGCVQLFVTSMGCGPPGSSVCEIFQARTVEWFAISFSRETSQPRDRTCISCVP